MDRQTLNEAVGIKGTITIQSWDGEKPLLTSVGNVVSVSLKKRIIRTLRGTATPSDNLPVSRFVFGTSNEPTNKNYTHLTHEFNRKEVLESQESGEHFLATCNIGYLDLVTAVATISAAVNTGVTELTVGDSSGFRVGDYVELNPTPANLLNARYSTVVAIPDGTHVHIEQIVPAPNNGDKILQLIREAGVLIGVNSTNVDDPDPTNSVFDVADASAFAPGDFIAIRSATVARKTMWSTIDSIDGNEITVDPPFPEAPEDGDFVENGVLANHAQLDPPFRKTDAQVATAHVDFDFT